ncbi:membrane protein YqaA, SNARE-associated domain [Streptoalloteichus hindustanus]|uniref:Membrane protein YqaA, SNARE-associated domain n=1 Tax=Streptoalloteichus hindustanus TaxID=2017 RepID=A0A1M5AZ74_STRHI|nr:membrane protein YqaA, SNARE-associated domain [Streptoalloteichus hindustanus]
MLVWVWLPLSTFGVAVLSALIPVISMEVYLVGVVLHAPELPWWLLGLVVAVGQIAGKLLYFYAGRGSLPLPRLLRRKAAVRGRWAEHLDRFREQCQRRPAWSVVLLLVSATASLPPFAATSVVAGVANIAPTTFVVTGLVGRFARFGALAAAPALYLDWMT